MQKNSAILTVACVMLCWTFNYTFPLRRESSKWNIFVNRNDSQQCNKKYLETVLERTKKMAEHIENALKIIKATSVNSNGENRKSKKQPKRSKNQNTDDNFSNFEEMVIKKKNPYLDLKELELKYYNPKNTRQSVHPGPNLGEDLSLSELSEDEPNVEITNRGLTGFAIPTKLLKTESKPVLTDPPNVNSEKVMKQPDHPNRVTQLLTLEDEIRKFQESKANK